MMLPWMIIFQIMGLAIVTLVIVIPLGYLAMYIWVKQRQRTDYDYNIFDDPEIGTASRIVFSRMKFVIPAEYRDRVLSVKASDQHKGEQIQFNQLEGELICKLIFFMCF